MSNKNNILNILQVAISICFLAFGLVLNAAAFVEYSFGDFESKLMEK